MASSSISISPNGRQSAERAKFIGDFLSVKTRLCCCSVNEQKNVICPHPIRTVHALKKLDLLSACANTALGHATGGLSKCKFERFLLYKKWNSYSIFNLARSELVVGQARVPSFWATPHAHRLSHVCSVRFSWRRQNGR